MRLTDFASCAGCAAKMPPKAVEGLLKYLPTRRHPDLLVGTETHDDAGVFRVRPDLAMVQTVDFFPPVVDDPYTFGRMAAANALSDIYAMGGVPITALNLVCYPDDKIGPEWLGEILRGGAERCEAAGCTIVGGHSVRDGEIKFGMAVTGTIHPDRIVTNAGAKPGDVLILTKPLGTGFVTTAAKKIACPTELLEAAVESMTTLNNGACRAMLSVGVHAATDVTGFGLAGHAYEMAFGSNVTIELNLSALPRLRGIESIDLVKYRTRASKTNREYTEAETDYAANIDETLLEFAYDAQTSGGLLISVSEAKVDMLLAKLLEQRTLVAAVIGRVLPRGDKSLRLG